MVYSFLDVQVSIVGPGGSFALGSGAAPAKEGISVEFTEDKNRMVIGADGSVMHSLIASKAGRVTVRLLKTSPVNNALDLLYNFQTSSGLFHGQNLIVVTNPVTGDEYTCRQVAFSKFPKNDYAEEAGLLEWTFDAGIVDSILGVGIAQLAA
jgi:hypothetical protein